jgi:YidC/Oxa1 family membrane protein insertase
MARFDYKRKKMAQIYLIATLIGLLCLTLSACSPDSGSYDVSAEVSEPTHFIARFMLYLNDGIGIFGWTVVAFTVIIKLILSPLDIWQKHISRKNAKAMERMKPQLEALGEKYAEDKARYQQEQMALYKREKYSMFGACLPTIVTLVVFIVMFAGFREMVGYQYARDYKNSYDVFVSAMNDELKDEMAAAGETDFKYLPSTEANAVAYKEAVDKAQTAVYNSYYSDAQTRTRNFLWIKNVFVGDNWKEAVPTFLQVSGQDGFSTARLKGLTKDEYELVMGKVLGTGGWNEKKGTWNGWLMLPLFSILLSVVSQKLMSKGTAAPPSPTGPGGKDAAAANMKMMQWTMPIMVGVFGLLYSAAFALYMFMSSFVAIAFQAIFAVAGKIMDKRDEAKLGMR